MIKPLQQMLEEGADQLGLKITPLQISQLLSYIETLDKWNSCLLYTSDAADE